MQTAESYAQDSDSLYSPTYIRRRLRTVRESIEYFTDRSDFQRREASCRRKDVYRLGVFLAWTKIEGIHRLIDFDQMMANKWAGYCQRNFKRKGIEARIGLVERVFKADLNRDDPALLVNPFRNVRKSGFDPPGPIGRLSEDQIQRATECLHPLDASIFIILFETGMRVKELQHLRWEDIGSSSIDISTHDLFTPKTGESNGIPISRNCQAALDFMRRRTGKQAFILLGCRAACDQYINKRFRRFEDKVRAANPDIPHFSPKTMRSSLAMYLIDKDEKLHKIQRFLRHKSIVTTEKYYGRALLRHLHSSVSKLDDRKDVSVKFNMP